MAGFGVMQGNELFDAKPNFNTVASLCYLQASTYPFTAARNGDKQLARWYGWRAKP